MLKQQMSSNTILTILFLSLLAACSPAQVAPFPTTPPPAAAATHTPAPSQTPAPAATEPHTAIPPTPTTTDTPAPSETPSATPSPTPEAVTALTLRWVDVYAGPGEAYSVLASFAENIRLIVSGQIEGGDWLQVELSPQVRGWIASSNIQLTGDRQAVAVVEASSIPEITPTPAAAQTARIWVSFDQVSGGLRLYGSGLQPGAFYRIQVISDQGKMVLNTGINASASGEVPGNAIFRIGGLRVGVYTVQARLNDALAAQTTFTVEKKN